MHFSEICGRIKREIILPQFNSSSDSSQSISASQWKLSGIHSFVYLKNQNQINSDMLERYKDIPWYIF